MQLVIRQLRDGTGRVCIHWLIIDAKGPVQTPGQVVPTVLGPLKLGGTRGWIACNRQQDCVTPQQHGGETRLCLHSDDFRAITCPDCMNTPEYRAAKAAMDGVDRENVEAGAGI